MHKDKLPDGKKYRTKKGRSAGNNEIKLDTLYRAGLGRVTLHIIIYFLTACKLAVLH